MNIYRCCLTLLEATFFSSQEISDYYQTAPLIGNYALAYALGLCRTPYFNDGSIYYREHLSKLNGQEIYVTPVTLLEPIQFTLSRFNAQPDAYWYAMANNTIVTRPDGAWVRKEGKKWYVLSETGDRGKAVGLENRPQTGRIRFLSIGNQGLFYVISREPYEPPSYVRLGKFMSKARIEARTVTHAEVEAQGIAIPFLLNPNDLASSSMLTAFDLISVPPTPLIRNGVIDGHFYRLDYSTHLPVGMRFGVDSLPGG
jgi:CRISPR-associated protein Csc1